MSQGPEMLVCPGTAGPLRSPDVPLCPSRKPDATLGVRWASSPPARLLRLRAVLPPCRLWHREKER